MYDQLVRVHNKLTREMGAQEAFVVALQEGGAAHESVGVCERAHALVRVCVCVCMCVCVWGGGCLCACVRAWRTQARV
jgi:hypothetical protein